ncbi:HNH endonuclease [Flexivirga sp. ID2601S]|uniref:HNH endonuclease n=1 Tax=Flexivirga aerilata TaxID=1656889 RepID=A0A849ASJ9_9MICO|nr:HNH endonuclease signature motif containing protein [Flexivirga aerilata]NNG41250.1 HNH endonuclease [Flexivirga aerilata]
MADLHRALTPEVISGASTGELLEAAQVLLRAAFDTVRDDAGADAAGPSDVELLDRVRATQQVQNSAWATQTVCLDRLAANELRKHPDCPDSWTPLEVGARLGWSDRQAGNRLVEAGDAVRHAPRLLDRAGAGVMDGRKVAAVAGVLADGPAVASVIEDQLLDEDPEAWTSTKLTRRARRLRAKHAPVEADRAAVDRRRECTNVTCEPHWEPGMSSLTAVMPALDAAKVMAAINTHARLLNESTTTGKTIGEHRLDALTDLLLSDVQVRTELVLHVPFHTPSAPSGTVAPGAAAGDDSKEPAQSAGQVHVQVGAESPITAEDYLDQVADIDARHRQLMTIGGVATTDAAAIPDPADLDDWLDYVHHTPEALLEEEVERLLATPGLYLGPPGEPPDRTPQCSIGDVLVPGIGTVPADAVRALAGLLGTTASRALVDSATGVVAETACHSYTPGARLARHIRTRDQHCRFPGCTRPATMTDIDHVVRYPDGPTAAFNLQCLCRHHHRAKHEGGWQVTMTHDGSCTWISPGGYTYLTRPGDQPAPRASTA